MLSAFCDCYSLVKWQALKSGEFALSFVLSFRKLLLRLTEHLCDDTMSRVQTLNGVHVSCHQTSARDFECLGPLSLAHISLMELLVVLHVFGVELCYTRPK